MCFVGGELDTDDPAEVAAVRRAMLTARGEIKEIGPDQPAVGQVEATPAALDAALVRTLRARWRDEELDQL